MSNMYYGLFLVLRFTPVPTPNREIALSVHVQAGVGRCDRPDWRRRQVAALPLRCPPWRAQRLLLHQVGLQCSGQAGGGGGRQGATVVCVTSGANMNFDRLRLVSELAGVGARQEAMLATTIPEVCPPTPSPHRRKVHTFASTHALTHSRRCCLPVCIW